MLRWLTVLLGSLLTLFMLLVVLTLVALEFDNVLTATTIDQQTGEPRETHIWFIEQDGRVFLEAGNPGNPWIQDLRAGSSLNLIGAVNGQFSYQFVSGNHERIRQLMKAKYGWRDQWVSVLFDVSGSEMIEVGKTNPLD